MAYLGLLWASMQTLTCRSHNRKPRFPEFTDVLATIFSRSSGRRLRAMISLAIIKMSGLKQSPRLGTLLRIGRGVDSSIRSSVFIENSLSFLYMLYLFLFNAGKLL